VREERGTRIVWSKQESVREKRGEKRGLCVENAVVVPGARDAGDRSPQWLIWTIESASLLAPASPVRFHLAIDWRSCVYGVLVLYNASQSSALSC
jgi:hypothetical protein